MPAPDNACQCTVCRSACARKPGWFMPGEVEALAVAMGLSIQELFKQHLQVDYWAGPPDIFVLAPRIMGGEGGSIMGASPYGKCHWFARGKCAVHELGKPHECRIMRHDVEHVPGSHRAVAVAWDKPGHQAQIAALLGMEPSVRFSVADVLTLLSDINKNETAK